VGALRQMNSEVACARSEVLALYTASEGLYITSQLREKAAAEARAQVLSQQKVLSRYLTCFLLAPKCKALTQKEKEAAEARDCCCLLRSNAQQAAAMRSNAQHAAAVAQKLLTAAACC
jgi:hypothetical protein